MARTGRRRAMSVEQREEVLRLVREEGMSRRRTAEQVFGDARLRGRVDRILREAERADEQRTIDRILATAAEESGDASASDADLPTLEDLFGRYARSLRRRLEDPEERVTASELQTFARLELWLENKRRLRELNRLTREASD